MTTIPRFFFCGDKTKLERFTENDYIYAFRVQVPVFVIAPCRKLMVPPTSKKIDALMASGSVKGTIGIKSDARCFIVDAL